MTRMCSELGSRGLGGGDPFAWEGSLNILLLSPMTLGEVDAHTPPCASLGRAVSHGPHLREQCNQLALEACVCLRVCIIVTELIG